MHRTVATLGRVLLLSLALALPASAAVPRPGPSPASAPPARILLPAGSGLAQVASGGRVIASRVTDPHAPLRLVVAFAAPPVTVARARGLDATATFGAAQRLRSDLARLAATARATPAAPVPVAAVDRTYAQVFSGAAIRIAPELLERVRALPYVSAVSLDDTVRATLEESVPLIRADRVRAELGVDGAGIRVGIIDTGIDYHHAAFDGGFGPGHRVVGGYDFVNDDADPIDDYGHGTHVAGIVGGDGGGVVGVAPGVTFYAYKVLDSGGSGYESWILAALDRVLDPDGDPATDDALQVINLSLGGSDPRPDAPMSLALDHLMDAGVVCCVAAGNSSRYGSIGAPGTSRRAITVGASDKSDQLAWFSSKGPVAGTLDLKPDLVAPGVDIRSAAMGGGKVAMSGTSMATPHVAGVAALLRQLHPGWSSDVVKEALVGTSVDLAAPPLAQGAGRVDAYAAATAGFVIAPTHLAFGHTDGSVSRWSSIDTLHVTNLGATTCTVTFPDSVTLTGGAQAHVSPVSLALAAGETGDVAVRLVVDNAVTPFPGASPFAYTATLTARSGAESCRVPMSFHKAATLTVRSRGFVEWLLIGSPAGEISMTGLSSDASVLLAPGAYDVAASFYPRFRFVVREHVQLARDDSVRVEPSDATVHVGFANVGLDSLPATFNAGQLSLGPATGTWRFLYAGFPIDGIDLSPTSPDIRVEWVRASTNYHDRYLAVCGAYAGLTSSTTSSNLASDLHHVMVHFPAPAVPATPALYAQMAVPSEDYFGFATLAPGFPPITGPFDYDLTLMPSPYEGHSQIGLEIELLPWDATYLFDSSQPAVHLGPQLRLDRGWPVETYLGWLFAPRWAMFGGHDMRLASGAPAWRGAFANAGRQVVLLGTPDWNAPHLGADMYGTVWREPDLVGATSQGGHLIQSGTLVGSGGFDRRDGIVVECPDTGPTEFHASRDFSVRGRAATLDVDAHMVLGAPDPDPPFVETFTLYADGEATDSIAFATAVDPGVRCRLLDQGVPRLATFSVRQEGQAGWTPLTTRLLDGESIAGFPVTLSGPVALRLASSDTTGNAIQLTWDPAFVATPGNPRPDTVAVFALAGPRPNPASAARLMVDLTLPSAAPARLALYDLAGRSIAALDVGGLGAGRHLVRLAPRHTPPPGVYFLRLSQAGRSRTARVCVLD